MPKMFYECEFCGEKFTSKTACQEHEKKCLKNESNLPIKKITFSLSDDYSKIESKVTNIDFTHDTIPKTEELHTKGLSGYGYFRSEKERSSLEYMFKQNLKTRLPSYIQFLESEIKNLKDLHKSFSADKKENKHIEDCGSLDELIEILKKICSEKGIDFLRFKPKENKDFSDYFKMPFWMNGPTV